MSTSDTHHAEGLVNPKVRGQKKLLIFDIPEHVDSENIKLKIGPQSYFWVNKSLSMMWTISLKTFKQ
jgi:hypothetical protein